MAESIMGKPEHINVLIIRSGQSEWDRTGRLAGQADLPLCEQSKLELQDASSLLDGAASGVGSITLPDGTPLSVCGVLLSAWGEAAPEGCSPGKGVSSSRMLSRFPRLS